MTGFNSIASLILPAYRKVSPIPQRSRRIGIICALHLEARPLAAYRGLVIRVCGVAGTEITGAVRDLAARGCGLVVSWGTAGALSPRLRAGDLALPGRVVGPGGETLNTDAGARAQLHAALAGAGRRVVLQTLLESPRILATTEDKRRFTGGRDAAAVDMESGRIGQACAAVDVPFLALRAIVDQLDDRLPRLALDNTSPDGRLRIAPLLVSLIRYPAEWGPLIGLARRYRHARPALDAAARALASLP